MSFLKNPWVALAAGVLLGWFVLPMLLSKKPSA